MSEKALSHNGEERPATPPRRVLIYITGAVALLFAISAALFAVLLVSANHLADQAREEAHRSAEQAAMNQEMAVVQERQAQQQSEVATVARQEAEAQAADAELHRQKLQEQANEARQKAVEAEKNARAAQNQRAEAVEAERRARAQIQVADEQRKEETDRRREAQEQIIKLDVLHATHLLDEHDLPQGLLWCAEALRAANRERFPEEAHRMRLAVALSQHPRPIQAWFLDQVPSVLQMSPDGRLIVTADASGAAHLWDTATGKARGEALKHGAPITAAEFSPDSKHLLTAAADGHLHLWDIATGKPVFAPLAHDGRITHAQFSPDGKHLLSVSAANSGSATLHMWDAGKGTAVGKPLEQTGTLLAVGFSADGQNVLIASADRTIRRWNPATGTTAGVVVGSSGALEQAAFSDDGQRIVTVNDGAARVWQVASGQPATPPLRQTDPVLAVQFAAGGKRMLTIGKDRTVRIWDTTTGALVGSPLKHRDTVALATFGPDGRHVLTSCADGRVRLWNATTGDELRTIWQSAPVQQAAFGPDGSTLLTREGKVVRLWDLTVAEPPAPPPAETAAHTWFSPNGQLVLRADGTTAQLSTVEPNQPVGPPWKHSYPVTAAVFSPDSKRVATMCSAAGGSDPEWLIQVWDTATGKEVGPAISHLHPVLHFAINRDGRTALTVTAANQTEFRLGFYDVATGQRQGKEVLYSQPVNQALFTPDGKLAVVAMAGIVKTWDPTTATQSGKSTTHKAPLTQIVFSPDGKRMLTADRAGVAFIGEVGTGEAINQLPDHPGAVTFAVFSPDGKRVATCCADRSVRVWDVDKAKLIGAPMAQPALALAAFSPDGRWLATAAENRLRLWDASSGEAASPALPHAPEPAPITYLSIRPDGKIVTGTGPADDPRGRRTWTLLPDTRPVAELEEMVHLLTGQQLEGLTVTALSADAAKKAWDDLRPRFPADFAPSPPRTLAWIRRGLAECERAENWAGVISHLDHLMTLEPGRVELNLKRAAAHRALHQLDRVLADYTAALAQAKDRVDLWSLRAAVFVELRQWDRAADDYSHVIELTPNDLAAWAARGLADAELARWDRAAKDFGRVNARGGEEVGLFRDQALACLGAGDKAGYKQVCERMARRFGTKTAAAPTVAWTCSLADGALADLKPVLAAAERAQAAHPKSPGHLVAVAGLLYRSRQYPPALQRLENAQALRTANTPPTDWLILAMTQQRLGRADQAKKWLDMAAQEQSAVREARTWQERLEVSLLSKEADALLKGRP